MLEAMKAAIGEVNDVRFTTTLKSHAACLSSEGEISVEMEKTLKRMPGAKDAPKASVILEINANHPIADTLKATYGSDNDKLAKYALLLYYQACLIGGVAIDDPKRFTELVTELMI